MSSTKKIGYILLFIEPIIAAYIIYLMFGVWGSVFATVGSLILIYLSVWLISSIYEKSNIFREPEKAEKENLKSILVFNQTLDYLIYFPVKVIIFHYIYFNFSDGSFYILVYLLFIIISNESWRNRNTQESNSLFNEIKNRNS